MAGAALARPTHLYLVPFHKEHATQLVEWVHSADELHWLAPATQPPLTPAKVLEWQRANGRAFMGTSREHEAPLCYAELNPIGNRLDHLWLGHCLVCPRRRGQGIGGAFVRLLLAEAFHRLAAQRVSLIVFPENQSAVRCYLAAGFVLAGEEWHSFGGRPSERLLRLEVGSPSA